MKDDCVFNPMVGVVADSSGGAAAAKLAQPFSLRAEEQRQQARGQGKKPAKKKSRRRGRVRTAAKVAQASRHQDVFPQGVYAQGDPRPGNVHRHRHQR